MKMTAFFAVLLATYALQAAPNTLLDGIQDGIQDTSTPKKNECASKVSEEGNISDIMAQINPWGKWEGTSATGKKISVTLAKDSNGRFNGTANFNGQNVGPLGLTVCDYNGDYSLSISFFTIDFLIHSAKKIEILYAFDGANSVILNKK